MDNVATVAEPTSTRLDPGAVSPSAAGGGVPTGGAEPTLHDSIAAAVKEVSQPDEAAPDQGEGGKPEPKADDKAQAKAPEKAEEAKPKAEPKPAETKAEDRPERQRGTDGKFASTDPAKGEPQQDTKRRDADHFEAPASFLPDAKDVWRNVPRAVQREVERTMREHADQIETYRQSGERYEALREFDDLARSNGRDLRESLSRVVEFENLLQSNPLAGLNRILMEAGPKKADGQPISLMEVAQYVVNMGQQGYQQAVAPPQQRQDGQGEVQQLRARMAMMEAAATMAPIIERFRIDNPRYDELQNDIALFLQSGKVPTSLSPAERLAAAYDMAVRINPASHAPAPAGEPGPDPDGRADDFSGSKSIKSAPGSITPDVEPQRAGSIREELERAIRNQRRA